MEQKTIPFVLVESKEEQKITLPIPEEGQINEAVEFAEGTAIITSVEKVMQIGRASCRERV